MKILSDTWSFAAMHSVRMVAYCFMRPGDVCLGPLSQRHRHAPHRIFARSVRGVHCGDDTNQITSTSWWHRSIMNNIYYHISIYMYVYIHICCALVMPKGTHAIQSWCMRANTIAICQRQPPTHIIIPSGRPWPYNNAYPNNYQPEETRYPNFVSHTHCTIPSCLRWRRSGKLAPQRRCGGSTHAGTQAHY